MNDSIGRRGAGGLLDKRDPGARVSREAQGDAGLLTGRSDRVGNNGEEDPRSGTLHYKPKGTKFTRGRAG